MSVNPFEVFTEIFTYITATIQWFNEYFFGNGYIRVFSLPLAFSVVCTLIILCYRVFHKQVFK